MVFNGVPIHHETSQQTWAQRPLNNIEATNLEKKKKTYTVDLVINNPVQMLHKEKIK